jgi:cobyrinic acid a,c-diamide synthase
MANAFLPRLVIAAMRGGAGKTVLSLCMGAAWKKQGIRVAPFKKGPDYIDSAWLSLAGSQTCRNLDTFLMGAQEVLRSFGRWAEPRGISLIEGNRGLYDGMDAEGTHSTAELAKILKTPVILILDSQKITRTSAAMVLGCQKLDPEVDIQGVILNKVARSRQEMILRLSIEQACHLPILGAVPRIDPFPFPERHLGLIPPQEHSQVRKALNQAAEISEKYIDLQGIWEIAQKAAPFHCEMPVNKTFQDGTNAPIIGVIRNSAFQFYYPENLEALSDRGAKLVEINSLQDKEIPPLDALYIGGGFPETHARQLSENKSFRDSLREAVEHGLPVFAECGGLMYLGENLVIEDQRYPMVGALPISFAMEKRPQGHGYTILEVEKENPFFPLGTILKGHEFHYSFPIQLDKSRAYFCLRVKRGAGVDGQRDGVCYKNVFATYSHFHALGAVEWADALVQKAEIFQAQRMKALP